MCARVAASGQRLIIDDTRRYAHARNSERPLRGTRWRGPESRSDGVTEARRGTDRELYGDERLRELVTGLGDLPGHESSGAGNTPGPINQARTVPGPQRVTRNRTGDHLIFSWHEGP